MNSRLISVFSLSLFTRESSYCFSAS